MKPGYLTLYQSGELKKRAENLWERLSSCDICPRKCAVNRLKGELGYCNSSYHPIVSSFCSHHGEEPAVSGKLGSGTIFFGNCNMRCVYCQNHQISQNPNVQIKNEVSLEELAGVMLSLQDKNRCHNINLVSPSHFVPQIINALLPAVPRGLKVPLVYNTNSYDSLETLKLLDGVVDIYLADIKYASDAYAEKFSDAPDYVNISQNAIKEMHRQVGVLKVNEEGVAERGLIVRHLILPNGLAESGKSLKWLAEEVSEDTCISLMSQYHPCHKAMGYPPLNRGITEFEYTEAVIAMEEAGLGCGWKQDITSSGHYLPDFNDKECPFG